MLKYVIYGERCSGTNYLQKLIELNFNAQIRYDLGSKHFFGFNNLNNTDDTLFICIVRDIHDWMNSFYKKKWHLPKKLKNINNFLNSPFYSINDNNSGKKDFTEIMEDRNIYTKKRYKNIFQLRHIKNKYLFEDLPHKVTNYILIKYEDLINNFEETMNKLKEKGLKQKEDINFPINWNYYKKSKKVYTKDTKYLISKDQIYNHPDFKVKYEKNLKYIK